MPFDASGNFNRDFPPGGWQGDAAATTKIRADRHDTHDSDLANGLSQCITKDGRTTITANIPMNGKRITGLGNPDPASPQDAATKAYVDTLRTFATSMTITGADANGRLVFSSPTGANGLSWTAADMSWLARLAESSKTGNRLVLNNTAAGDNYLGDVAVLDELGNLNLTGSLTFNLSYASSGTAGWKTIQPGYAGRLLLDGPSMRLSALDAATTLDAYKAATLREFYTVTNSGGSVFEYLTGAASGKTVGIFGMIAGSYRWGMYLGDGAVESGNTGSNFILYSYDNDATGHAALSISRLDRTTLIPGSTTIGSVPGGVNALTVGSSSLFTVTANGAICTAYEFVASANVYAGTNGLSLQPALGSAFATSIATNGDMTVRGTVAAEGYRERPGTAGSYGSEYMNSHWDGNLHFWVNTQNWVTIVEPVRDARTKRDIEPLPPTWEAVKRLKPVRYKNADYFVDGVQGSWASDDERWGFMPHELQDALLPTAATGHRDNGVLQDINPMAIIAALTATLQEAMARIESLEEQLA